MKYSNEYECESECPDTHFPSWNDTNITFCNEHAIDIT